MYQIFCSYQFLFYIILFFVSCKSRIESETLERIHPRNSKLIQSSVAFYKEVLPGLKGKKVMLVTNPSGIGQNPKRIQNEFNKNHVKIVSLLGLEHGFLGLEEDFSNQPVTVDKIFNLPIYHIYKLKKKELLKILNEVDAIVFDVQDMGMRCYTYLTVLKRIMDGISGKKVELIVLDHINPAMEIGPRGDSLEKDFENFAGAFPSLLFTGLTMGESANLYNSEYLKNKVNLNVIPVENFKRGMKFETLGIPWNTPSPNLPNLDSARNYFSLVLLEGINVSVGRGTPAPFVYFGAPWLKDREELSNFLDSLGKGKYYFQPIYFKPAFSKYEGKICLGLRMNLVEFNYDPIQLSYEIILYLKRNYKKDFQWVKWGSKYMVDNLWGSDRFRLAIEADLDYKNFHKEFSNKEITENKRIKKYYIYQ
ncbi:MAG: DUF1343 domain-containing protein [Leptospiraceae bacterium]|nr:DUF1343 domain-containing protein [Leptospiraceae bacterium]MCP5511738.1 DUF1343 domain-containing protein [Leptospiraceae bacterium]